MNYAAILDSFLPPGDALKVFLFFLAIVAVYVLARRASSMSNASYEPPASAEPPHIPGVTSPPARLPDPAESGVTGAPHRFATINEPSLGRLQITGFRFDTFDPEAGPADPEVFAEELMVELYDPDVLETFGYKWTHSYFVASPKGLDRLLRDKNWDSVFADSVFVFRRYDLREIRRTIIEHIAEQQKLVRNDLPDTKPDQEHRSDS